MARQSNEQTLGEAIKGLIKSYGFENKLNKVKVANAWEKIMGNYISSKTKKISIQNDTLVVNIDSSALRSELNFAKEKLIKQINDECGKELVKKIIIR